MQPVPQLLHKKQNTVYYLHFRLLSVKAKDRRRFERALTDDGLNPGLTLLKYSSTTNPMLPLTR